MRKPSAIGSSTAKDAASVCSCDASMRPGVKGTVHGVSGVLRRLLDARAAGQHDQVGERDLLAAGRRAVELALDSLERLQHLRQLGPAG